MKDVDPIATIIGRNLSPGDLAALLETSPAVLYHLENGFRRPTVGRLVDLARVLRVGVVDLVAGLGEDDRASIVPVMKTPFWEAIKAAQVAREP